MKNAIRVSEPCLPTQPQANVRTSMQSRNVTAAVHQPNISYLSDKRAVEFQMPAGGRITERMLLLEPGRSP